MGSKTPERSENIWLLFLGKRQNEILKVLLKLGIKR
jgi:hypothetical protein